MSTPMLRIRTASAVVMSLVKQKMDQCQSRRHATASDLVEGPRQGSFRSLRNSPNQPSTKQPRPCASALYRCGPNTLTPPAPLFPFPSVVCGWRRSLASESGSHGCWSERRQDMDMAGHGRFEGAMPRHSQTQSCRLHRTFSDFVSDLGVRARPWARLARGLKMETGALCFLNPIMATRPEVHERGCWMQRNANGGIGPLSTQLNSASYSSDL